MGGHRAVAFWLAVVGASALAGSGVGILVREGIEAAAGPPPVAATGAHAPAPGAATPALPPASFATPWATSTPQPR